MPSTDDHNRAAFVQSQTDPTKYLRAVGNVDGTDLAESIAAALSGLAVTTQDYSIRIDDAGSGVVYIGKATVGASTASAVWKVMRVTESGTPADTTIEYADGNSNFDNVWNNRASLTYS